MNDRAMYDEFLKDPEATNFVPVKVLQKLQLLNRSLDDQVIELTMYSQLSADEVQSLISIPREAKLQLYENIIGTFLKQDLMTGTIDVLGKSSFFWNERSIEVNLKTKQLRLQRKDKRKEPHCISLQQYTLSKTGIKNSHYTLTLTGLKNMKLGHQTMVLGTHVKEDFETWNRVLSQCCHNGDMMSSSKLTESKIEFREEEKKVVQLEEEPQISLEPEPLVSRFPAGFQALSDMVNFRYLASENDFKTLQFKHGVRILQSTKDRLVFKMITMLPDVGVETVIEKLSDPTQVPEWNRRVQASKVNVMVNEDMSVLWENLTSFGWFYKERMLELQRCRYVDDQGTPYLLQQSTQIKYHALWLVTGHMDYGIHGIFSIKNKKQLLLLFETRLNFLGRITQSQNTSMVVRYLEQFVNLKHYLKQSSLKGSIERELSIAENYKSFVLERKSFNGEELPQHNNIELIQSVPKPTDDDPAQLRRCFDEILRNEHWWKAVHVYELGVNNRNPCNKRMLKSPEGGHYFFAHDWEMDQKRGVLKFINQAKLEDQKKILKFLLKKFGSNLLQGKSLTTISMPLYIFEKRSNLERMAYSLSFAPQYLEKAAGLSDPVEQMKQAFIFGLSTTIVSLNLQKPFNPILGETYQGWINGCPIYIEQVCHHPPICAIQFFGRGYKMHGHLESQANLGAQTVTGRNFGYLQIDFEATGNSIQWSMCTGILGGITFGDRVFYFDGNTWFVDVKNQLVASIQMNPNYGFMAKKKELDYYEGHIYRIDEREVARFKRETYRKYTGIPPSNTTFTKMARLEGRWDQYFEIDGQQVFNIDRDSPFYLHNDQLPLASDCQYREDILAWKLDDFEFAMEQKEKLEQLQRLDRKLRAKFGKK